MYVHFVIGSRNVGTNNYIIIPANPNPELEHNNIVIQNDEGNPNLEVNNGAEENAMGEYEVLAEYSLDELNVDMWVNVGSDGTPMDNKFVFGTRTQVHIKHYY